MKPDKLMRILDDIQSAPESPPALLERFCEAYHELSRPDRSRFFTELIHQLEVPKASIREPLEAALAEGTKDPARWSYRLTELRRALESPRLRAFRRFLNASGGLKFLLDLRADIITAQRQEGLELGPLDEEIAHLFESWFQHGFLFLQEITQESPYRQIRFLKEHDLVHPMASLEEMGSRLGEDRRCFALYHHAMPEKPIVFIEAALTRRIPGSIHEILDGADQPQEREPDTAIFYSINNTQQGLSGLGLGKLLIFRVVEAIKSARPQIRTFATLSPVSGFWPRYLRPILEGNDRPYAASREDILEKFSPRLRERLTKGSGDEEAFARALMELLSERNWIEDGALARELAKPLREVAYDYLMLERDPRGKPLNPVAGFHLGNGARLSPRNVHFGANRTERGLGDALSLMVSYVYSSTWLHELRRTARSALPRKG